MRTCGRRAGRSGGLTKTEGCARFPEPKNEYYEAFSAHFDHALAVTDVATGHPLCVVDNGPVSTNYNVAGYVVTPAAAEQLAAFHATVTLKRAPFDGIYIDEFNGAFPNRWLATFNNQSQAFDTNNDGVADTPGDLAAQYAAYKPYFSKKLREAVGDDALIIANAGTLSGGDPSLNGITIEAENCCVSTSPPPDGVGEGRPPR